MICQPGTCVDHYQITRLLGSGGANCVYLAQDQRTRQDVILKFPSDDLIGGAAIFKRYQREVEMGKYLVHPCLQRYLNFGEERSRDYLVLEYLSGQTLRAVMKQYAPAGLSIEEVLRIILQVGETVASLHEQGVIHQDIKPENIMVMDTGEIKLLDLGIAQWKDKQHVSWHGFSSLVGTPDYMAPERLEGQPGTICSDIYAVGMVLYELLCGRTPFEETDGFALVSEHISHDPPIILQFNPTLSPTLTTVVMRAIRRDPEKRYVSMDDLLNDLRHLDKVIPVDYLPCPPKLGGRYRQVIRVALIVMIIFLALITFGVLVQLIHPTAR